MQLYLTCVSYSSALKYFLEPGLSLCLLFQTDEGRGIVKHKVCCFNGLSAVMMLLYIPKKSFLDSVVTVGLGGQHRGQL